MERTAFIKEVFDSSDPIKIKKVIKILRTLESSEPNVKDYYKELKLALDKYEKTNSDSNIEKILSIINHLDFNKTWNFENIFKELNEGLPPRLNKNYSLKIISENNQVILEAPLLNNKYFTIGDPDTQADYKLSIATLIKISFYNGSVLIQEDKNYFTVAVALNYSKIYNKSCFQIKESYVMFKIGSRLKFIYKVNRESTSRKITERIKCFKPAGGFWIFEENLDEYDAVIDFNRNSWEIYSPEKPIYRCLHRNNTAQKSWSLPLLLQNEMIFSFGIGLLKFIIG
jgi:hypothetical protein